MDLQVGLPRKPLAARHALKGFFPGVNPVMRFERGLGGKELPADVALVRLALVVDLHVVREAVLRGVLLAAHPALDRLLSYLGRGCTRVLVRFYIN